MVLWSPGRPSGASRHPLGIGRVADLAHDSFPRCESRRDPAARFHVGGADTILTFSNAVEMANALKAGNKINYKPRVLSAWGLANPDKLQHLGPLADLEALFAGAREGRPVPSP